MPRKLFDLPASARRLIQSKRVDTIDPRVQEFFSETSLDLERKMPQDWTMQHFNDLPFRTRKILIESQNTGRKYKPLDIRTYPGLAESGVKLDPHRQKVCPICFMVLQRSSIQRFFGGQCPKCGCRLQV